MKAFSQVHNKRRDNLQQTVMLEILLSYKVKFNQSGSALIKVLREAANSSYLDIFKTQLDRSWVIWCNLEVSQDLSKGLDQWL